MATVTAFATMSAGWHRAGDSMAAFLLVGVWTAVASAAVVIAQTPAASDPAPFEWPASARWLAAVSAAVFILGLTLGAALDTAGSIRDSTLGSWNAFIVGGLLITGTGIGVILSILHLLELMDTSSQQTTSPPATSRRDAQ